MRIRLTEDYSLKHSNGSWWTVVSGEYWDNYRVSVTSRTLKPILSNIGIKSKWDSKFVGYSQNGRKYYIWVEFLTKDDENMAILTFGE